MDRSLLSEVVMFWPIILAAAVAVLGCALVLALLWVIEFVQQLERFVQNYADVGAPDWWHPPHSHTPSRGESAHG